MHVGDRNITATRIHTWCKTREPHGDRDLSCLVVCGCIDPNKDGYIFSDFMGISMVLWKRGVDGDQMGIDASSSINAYARSLRVFEFASTSDDRVRREQGASHRANRHLEDEEWSFVFSKISQVTWVS